MITKKEMDNILVDVNRVLSNMSSEIKALEARVVELESAKSKSTSTTKTNSQEKA